MDQPSSERGPHYQQTGCRVSESGRIFWMEKSKRSDAQTRDRFKSRVDRPLAEQASWPVCWCNLFVQQKLASALLMAYYMVAGRGVNSLVERLVQKFTLAHSTLSRNPSAHDQRAHGTPRSGVQRDIVFDPRIKELSSVFFVELSLTQHNRPKGNSVRKQGGHQSDHDAF